MSSQALPPVFHPATLLIAWGGLALVLQQMSPAVLGAASLLFLPLALGWARLRTIRLLGRARWLLLSLVLLFAFATPGQPVQGVPGITVEGLRQAGEHCFRLVLLLASLAVLHEALGTSGLMAGLHALLFPLSALGNLRERIVARLMLVLDYAEGEAAGHVVMGWRAWLAEEPAGAAPDRLALPVPSPGWPDWLVLGLLAAGMAAWLLLA